MNKRSPEPARGGGGRNPAKSAARFATKAAAVLLLVTGALKLLSLTAASKILSMPDPVLGIPYQWTMLCGGLGEIAVAAILVTRVCEALRLLTLFWVGACFCGYHVALAALDPLSPCPCLGTLTTQFGLSPNGAKLIALALGAFFLCTPIGMWLASFIRSVGVRRSAPGETCASKSLAPGYQNG